MARILQNRSGHYTLYYSRDCTSTTPLLTAWRTGTGYGTHYINANLSFQLSAIKHRVSFDLFMNENISGSHKELIAVIHNSHCGKLDYMVVASNSQSVMR